MHAGKGTAQYLGDDVGVALSSQSTECGLHCVVCCCSIDTEDVVVAPLAHPSGSARENCPLAGAPEASASKARVLLVSWKGLSSTYRSRQLRAFLVLIFLRFASISNTQNAPPSALWTQQAWSKIASFYSPRGGPVTIPRWRIRGMA